MIMYLDQKYRMPLILAFTYLLDLLSTMIIDPQLDSVEANPIARAFGWGYAFGASIFFWIILSILWVHARDNVQVFDLGRKYGWKEWFTHVFRGKGASKRWVVALGLMFAPASAAMKVVLFFTNSAFFLLIRVFSWSDNRAFLDSIGMEDVQVFSVHLGIFTFFMVMMYLSGVFFGLRSFSEHVKRNIKN